MQRDCIILQQSQRKSFFNIFIYYDCNVICYTCFYMYTKAFLLHLIKAEKEHKKRDGETGVHKLNEMGAPNMK